MNEIMPEHIDIKRIIRKLLLSQSMDIPVFHEVALQLIQMMNDHSYRIEEVIRLVHKDTALAAEMLKQANTTYISGKSPITTIKDAIVRLGSQQVVNLAFTASMANNRSDNPVINTYLRNLWHHSHAVAIASAWLAIQVSHDKKIQDINYDEVYLAGLLHDIGKLYLLKSIDNLIKAGILQTDDGFIDEILDELNIQLGVKVMKHWNIPEIYSNTLERHTAVKWKCRTNDYFVAAVRLSCKIHDYIERGIEVTETSEAFDHVKEELFFLNVDDVSDVYNFIKTIAD